MSLRSQRALLAGTSSGLKPTRVLRYRRSWISMACIVCRMFLSHSRDGPIGTNVMCFASALAELPARRHLWVLGLRFPQRQFAVAGPSGTAVARALLIARKVPRRRDEAPGVGKRVRIGT